MNQLINNDTSYFNEEDESLNTNDSSLIKGGGYLFLTRILKAMFSVCKDRIIISPLNTLFSVVLKLSITIEIE